jgi:hypothetical protein
MKKNKVIMGLLILVIMLSSCNLPQDRTDLPVDPIPATQTPGISPTTETPPKKLSEHRISIRQVDGVGEFFDKQTKEKFTPRGVNYAFVPHGNGYTNLILRVGIYNPERTREDFARIAELGYNTVRVFLDHCNKGPGCIGGSDNVGLNPDYLDNIADMMVAGHETGLYLLFTSNDLPDQGGYSEEANFGSGGDFAGYRNSYYLRPGAITATRRYWRDLLTGLVERNARFDAVLGWQLLNEQWMFADQPPLSLTSGIVETTTGSYDMSHAEQKKQMVSDGIIYYIGQMKEEILEHDPTALVTMGFFVPELVAPGWYVETASLLEKSDLDFFDFHAYPGDISLREHVEAFGMLDYDAKPIILGEYGAFRKAYPQLLSGARAVSDWAAEACIFGFDGWLYWSYYPSDASAGDRTWGMTDEDQYLLNLFAPQNQPDPCIAVEIPTDNRAYNKPVRASQSLAGEPPEHAVDESAGTQWSAGAGPVQWIEIDLQDVYRITEIRLLVAQWPEGNTLHRIQTRASSAEAFQTVHEFNELTRAGDWLIFKPDIPVEGVALVRIQTISSPSWVAWKEIQVYGESTDP